MAGVVKLDAQYLTERAGIMKGAADPISSAMQLMKKARLSSGLFFRQREHINSEIDSIRNEVTKTAREAERVENAFAEGAKRVENWERETRSRENALTSRLSKTWGFESANWSRDGKNSGSQNISVTPIPLPLDSGGNSNIAGKDMNSWYYNQNLSGVPRMLTNDYDGKSHMNCVYYARARAMEANSLDSYSDKGNGSDIQANSIAHFPGHDVFIEIVERDAGGQATHVVFTESNWGGAADGHEVKMPYSEFVKRGGSSVSGYTYF